MENSRIEQIALLKRRCEYLKKYENIYWDKIKKNMYIKQFVYTLLSILILYFSGFYDDITNIPFFLKCSATVIMTYGTGVLILLIEISFFSKAYDKYEEKLKRLKEKQKIIRNECNEQMNLLDLKDLEKSSDFLKTCDNKFISSILHSIEYKNDLNKEFWYGYKKIYERYKELKCLEFFEYSTLEKLQNKMLEEEMSEGRIEERLNVLLNKKEIKIESV